MQIREDVYTLGISCFYHDSSAVILNNSEIIAAIQEERITRKKFDNNFPINAIHECLKIANIDINKINEICFYEDLNLKFNRIFETNIKNQPFKIFSNFKKINYWLRNKYFVSNYIKHFFPEYKKIINFFPHHLSHSASAFYPSPFKEAAILTIDGVGEWCTTMISKGEDNKIKILKELFYPHSVGFLYSSFTQLIGFKVDSGEYKLMGLAPYGEPKYVSLIKENIVKIYNDGRIELNLKFFDFISGKKMINERFLNLFELNYIRKEKDKISQKHMDIASSIQIVIEEIIFKLAKHSLELCKSKNLCLAGGVALNCVANGKLLKSNIFKNIWIQPASGDAGGSLGACYLSYFYKNQNHRKTKVEDSQKFSYLGNKFDEDEIEKILKNYSVKFDKLNSNNRAKIIADLIFKDNIIGIFQDKMEFGPRALGNRSILGNPMNKNMQKIMNLKIKFRESFRPFAPIIKEDKVIEWFEGIEKSPYMLFVTKIKQSKKNINKMNKEVSGFEKLKYINNKIPAVIHVDDTARIQTVSKESNEKMYNILNEFENLSNCPILINTSFNVRGEPIVNTPYDALKCFFNTHIDFLILENFLISKENQTKELIDEDFVNKFELD